MLQAAGLAPAASLPSNTDWLPLGLRNKQPHWNDSERTSQHCCQSCDLQPARSRQELSVSPWRLLLLLLACAPEALAARRQNSNFTYAAYIELPLFQCRPAVPLPQLPWPREGGFRQELPAGALPAGNKTPKTYLQFRS